MDEFSTITEVKAAIKQAIEKFQMGPRFRVTRIVEKTLILIEGVEENTE